MTRAGPVLLAIALVVVSVSCSVTDERPRPTVTTQAAPVVEDRHLRPVRMTSGRALTYVHPGTAAQILCQVLDKAGWARLLGGEVGRRPLELPYAGCLVATADRTVRVQLRESEDAFAGTTTLAGRPALTYERPGERVVYVLALTDDALRAEPFPIALRTLEVETTGGEVTADRDVSLRVLDEIVPVLGKAGAPVPALDEYGDVPYAGTPLSAGDQFIDLPGPVQGLQLCTLLLRGDGFRLAADDVRVTHDGECRLSRRQGDLAVRTEDTRPGTDYRDRVGERPANVSAASAEVRLRDDADVALKVSGPDAVTLAEKLVPWLTGD